MSEANEQPLSVGEAAAVLEKILDIDFPKIREALGSEQCFALLRATATILRAVDRDKEAETYECYASAVSLGQSIEDLTNEYTVKLHRTNKVVSDFLSILALDQQNLNNLTRTFADHLRKIAALMRKLRR